MENMNEQEVAVEIVKEKKSIGKVTGFRFIKAWGFYLEKYAKTPGNKNLILENMLTEFPQKENSVRNWLEWYKSYGNMGKIKGYEKLKNEKVKWIPEVKVETTVE